jgi:hypothetical protein
MRIKNPRAIWVHLRYRSLLGIVTPTISSRRSIRFAKNRFWRHAFAGGREASETEPAASQGCLFFYASPASFQTFTNHHDFFLSDAFILTGYRLVQGLGILHRNQNSFSIFFTVTNVPNRTATLCPEFDLMISAVKDVLAKCLSPHEITWRRMRSVDFNVAHWMEPTPHEFNCPCQPCFLIIMFIQVSHASPSLIRPTLGKFSTICKFGFRVFRFRSCFPFLLDQGPIDKCGGSCLSSHQIAVSERRSNKSGRGRNENE